MPSHQDTIDNLWTAARAMFARMREAVGEAAAVAARTILALDERRIIRGWLTPLEAMTRKVVLIHAMALARQGDTYARAAPNTHAPPLSPAGAYRPAPPAVTTIQLPPPLVRMLTANAAAAAAAPCQRTRPPSLRLWPRRRAGPRVRDLGANLLVRNVERERARLALARRLKAARSRRAPESQRLARRIDALERLLAHPLPAARRLARRLTLNPLLAVTLAARRVPRTSRYREPEYTACFGLALADAYAFNLKPCDTS